MEDRSRIQTDLMHPPDHMPAEETAGLNALATAAAGEDGRFRGRCRVAVNERFPLPVGGPVADIVHVFADDTPVQGVVYVRRENATPVVAAGWYVWDVRASSPPAVGPLPLDEIIAQIEREICRQAEALDAAGLQLS